MVRISVINEINVNILDREKIARGAVKSLS